MSIESIVNYSQQENGQLFLLLQSPTLLNQDNFFIMSPSIVLFLI